MFVVAGASIIWHWRLVYFIMSLLCYPEAYSSDYPCYVIRIGGALEGWLVDDDLKRRGVAPDELGALRAAAKASFVTMTIILMIIVTSLSLYVYIYIYIYASSCRSWASAPTCCSARRCPRGPLRPPRWRILAHIYICIYTHTYTHTHTYIYTYIYIYVYIYIYIYIHTPLPLLHIYIYIYIHIHIHIYIYTHTSAAAAEVA